MSKIEVILTEPSRTSALRAGQKAGKQLLNSEFIGPVFADAKYKFNAQGIEIHADDKVYAYPAHTYSRIKISPSGSVE